jgi:zinc transport system substrate-binding protein
MRRAALMAGAGLSALASAGSATAEPKVVVTIKPLHALVMGVMAGVAVPDLLVKGSASPHTYSLKPSEARLLHQADLFFRMSETVEPFTAKVVTSLPRRVEVVTLQDAPGLALLPLRSGATFERHVHKGHDHDHGKPKKGEAVDGHVWLDPDNAKVMVDRIEQALTAPELPLGAPVDAMVGGRRVRFP